MSWLCYGLAGMNMLYQVHYNWIVHFLYTKTVNMYRMNGQLTYVILN